MEKNSESESNMEEREEEVCIRESKLNASQNTSLVLVIAYGEYRQNIISLLGIPMVGRFRKWLAQQRRPYIARRLCILSMKLNVDAESNTLEKRTGI